MYFGRSSNVHVDCLDKHETAINDGEKKEKEEEEAGWRDNIDANGIHYICSRVEKREEE